MDKDNTSNAPAAVGAQRNRQCPWCAIVLVVLAVICHTLTLMGNLATADTFSNIGKATGGWSDVGLGVSESMIKEVEHLMSETNHMLTEALKQIEQMETMMDFVLGASGNTTQMAVTMLKTGDEKAMREFPHNLPHNLLDGAVSDLNIVPIARSPATRASW